jgi:hypothetical protein
MSSDFENDRKIIEYCNNNKSDSKCQCLSLDNTINLYSKSSFSPVYCWFSPCRNPDNYITSIIKAEQNYCNVTICEISIGDILLNDNGNITAKNDCVRNINPILSFIQVVIELINFDIPFSNINLIYPIIIILTLLLFFK